MGSRRSRGPVWCDRMGGWGADGGKSLRIIGMIPYKHFSRGGDASFLPSKPLPFIFLFFPGLVHDICFTNLSQELICIIGFHLSLSSNHWKERFHHHVRIHDPHSLIIIRIKSSSCYQPAASYQQMLLSGDKNNRGSTIDGNATSS